MHQSPLIPKRALISVSNKTGIVDFARGLVEAGVEIISTGGTKKTLAEHNIPVKDIAEFTGFPEIMDGRVKTLHPLVHGGILGLRDAHAQIAQEHNIQWIDLVVVNLYPFAETIQKQGVSEEEVIENIDIGGPAMIRSAAKNAGFVAVITDTADYETALMEIKNGGITYQTRINLRAKAFGHTAQYDAIIHNHFTNNAFSEHKTLTFSKFQDLRYGENPHQAAAAYKNPLITEPNILNAIIHQGKQLSYNNIGDADAALATIMEFSDPACVVVKHANPCGVAIGTDIADAFKRAYHADALSAFGGIIALNRPCTLSIAQEITAVFAEIVLAPGFEVDALAELSKKKNLRVLELGSIPAIAPAREFRSIMGGMLMQDVDTHALLEADLKIVTETLPSQETIAATLFAWRVIKHVKSNAIVITNTNTTIGIGAGQVSRVDAVDTATKKGGAAVHGAVLASDAFFPFRDSIDKIAPFGVSAIIQPGGSIKDDEVIAACNEHGITMLFTGTRAFKH